MSTQPPPPPGSGQQFPGSTPIPGGPQYGGSPYGSPSYGGPQFPGGPQFGGPQFPGGPQFGGPQFPGGPFQVPPPRRGGSWITLIWFLIPLIGLGVGLFVYFNAKSDADTAQRRAQQTIDTLTVPTVSIPQVSVPRVTIPSITVPGATIPEVPPTATIPGASIPVAPPSSATPGSDVQPGTYLDADHPGKVVARLVAAAGDSATFAQVLLYPDHALADKIVAPDGSTVRSIVLNSSGITTVPVDTPNAAPDQKPFAATDVDWAVVSTAIAAAPGASKVDGAKPAYVIVGRTASFGNGGITLRVYVHGTSSDGYVVFDLTGKVIKAFP